MDHNPFDVRALRDRIGWTQDRLARFLGVDRSSISRMENGQALSGPVRRLLALLTEAADNGTADALCPEHQVAAE
ncbi:hypothetical protein MAXJ12_12812 [Mesorhizobium alhagi CCNWXJ12-2]|uniref:HTH cro/C1-type domain-containing protein n=2 Tax=Allomesorhizobium alhagi TaxID=475067 RepID=H0HQY0_9HYPH|nr:hypothetical protein MAXJ12_12812 [Mesorhizobium alhagi CCNWXJ12-2]